MSKTLKLKTKKVYDQKLRYNLFQEITICRKIGSTLDDYTVSSKLAPFVGTGNTHTSVYNESSYFGYVKRDNQSLAYKTLKMIRSFYLTPPKQSLLLPILSKWCNRIGRILVWSTQPHIGTVRFVEDLVNLA